MFVKKIKPEKISPEPDLKYEKYISCTLLFLFPKILAIRILHVVEELVVFLFCTGVIFISTSIKHWYRLYTL